MDDLVALERDAKHDPDARFLHVNAEVVALLQELRGLELDMQISEDDRPIDPPEREPRGPTVGGKTLGEMVHEEHERLVERKERAP